MVERIAEDLKPIKTEMKSLSRHIKQEIDDSEDEDKRRRIEDNYGSLAREFKARVLARDPDLDTSFGIHFTIDGETAMGNKIVIINGDNLIVDDEFYKGTPGLWNLITNTKQNQIGQIGIDFKDSELLEYVRLLEQTNVLYRNFDRTSPYPRANGSWKWENILKTVWDEWKKRQDGDGLDPVKSHKMYIQKKGKCYRVKTIGDGLYLSRHRGKGLRSFGDGVFMKRGREVYDGEGLIFGDNSPFENIPILGWLL